MNYMREGTVKMKSKAWSYFWWPSLDDDTEKKMKCEICVKSRREPVKSDLRHCDFLGSFYNLMILIIADAYSKWVEDLIMKKCDNLGCTGNSSPVTSKEFLDH